MVDWNSLLRTEHTQAKV